MIDVTATDALIEAVRDVARDEIMPRFRSLGADEIDAKTGPEDLVTVADLAAESALGARIAAILPQAEVVGEEAVSADPSRLALLSGDAPCVIVDPVDGTANFARGLAVFGVILAVREAGETTFGLLYDPVMDDWVMARAGEGAWYCRPDRAPSRLRVRAERAQDAQTCFVSPYLFPAERRSPVFGLMARFARAQTLRCSCHEYRMIALGHADAMISALSKPWDHAAGLLVVREAGGTGGPLDGTAYDAADPGRVLVCGTGARTVETLRETVRGALDP